MHRVKPEEPAPSSRKMKLRTAGLVLSLIFSWLVVVASDGSLSERIRRLASVLFRGEARRDHEPKAEKPLHIAGKVLKKDPRQSESQTKENRCVSTDPSRYNPTTSSV